MAQSIFCESFTSTSGDFPISYVNVYQTVNDQRIHPSHPSGPKNSTDCRHISHDPRRISPIQSQNRKNLCRWDRIPKNISQHHIFIYIYIYGIRIIIICIYIYLIYIYTHLRWDHITSDHNTMVFLGWDHLTLPGCTQAVCCTSGAMVPMANWALDSTT